jgi:hypothetical protein
VGAPEEGFVMENIWLASAVWIGRALVASAMENWLAVSIALLEIIIGAIAVNIITLSLTRWVNYLGGLAPSLELASMAKRGIDNEQRAFYRATNARLTRIVRIPVMAIGYSSRRRSLIPVIAIMAGRQEQGRP